MAMQSHSLLLATMSLAGCAVGPNNKSPSIDLKRTFASAIAADGVDGAWWRGFDDPLLATLVAKAVAQNTDLEQARARIQQSRAAASAAGADLLPSLDGTGGVDRARLSRETAIGHVATAFGLPRDSTEYAAGARASWEIDLFGGLRRGREAAWADDAATRAEAGAIAVAVSAETADAYLLLRALQARLAVARDQEANETILVDLVRRRVEQGLSSDRDLNKATGALEGVRASMAPLRAGIETQMNRIDVLVGEQPGSNRALLMAPVRVPTAPVPAGSDKPQDLLRRRPDVVAAERRLAASNARIGVAVADYYPHLSLSGLVGVASLGTSNLFTGGAVQASGGAGLRWRLFDFGRVDAEVSAARGRKSEALAAWRGSVLKAAEDVETALVQLSESRVQRAELASQVEALTKARDQARQAYQGGVVGLIDVTDADRELLAASNLLAEVKGEEAREAVSAYRALGGGWQPEEASQRVL
jgi:NodT family efflux transporter outer membrane factor (OMF) lipoprotein